MVMVKVILVLLCVLMMKVWVVFFRFICIDLCGCVV